MALVLFALYWFNTPDIRVELVNVQGVSAVRITNTGNANLKVTDVRFNDRADCPPQLVTWLGIPMPFNGQVIGVGEQIVIVPIAGGCLFPNIVRVTVGTDHGASTYYW